MPRWPCGVAGIRGSGGGRLAARASHAHSFRLPVARQRPEGVCKSGAGALHGPGLSTARPRTRRWRVSPGSLRLFPRTWTTMRSGHARDPVDGAGVAGFPLSHRSGRCREPPVRTRLEAFLFPLGQHAGRGTAAPRGRNESSTIRPRSRRRSCRLLADERSGDFVRNFTTQWLSLAKMKTVPINKDLYPTFPLLRPRRGTGGHRRTLPPDHPRLHDRGNRRLRRRS